MPSRRDFVLGLSGAVLGGACRRQEKQPPPSGVAQPSSVTGAAPPVASSASPAGATAPTTAGGRQRRRLGKTGVMVSLIGLGGFHLGKAKDEAASIRLVRDAIDAGVTFLDNCWDYNDGKSEERMGKALRDGYRQRAFLMTKLDGRTRAAATAQLEQSLTRLQTDVIDLVQIHEVIRDTDPKRAFAEDGVIAALIEAKKAGKLRFIGFTGHKDPKIHLAMLRTADAHAFRFDAVQMPLNVLDAHYRSFEREVLPVLLEKGIGVLGMKSMGAGKIVDSGLVTAEDCLRYALSLPTSVVICGMEKQEILAQNLRVARDFQPLSATEREGLLARTRELAADGKHEPFKTTHEYDGTTQHPHWLEEARI
jgi:aryl-alcohol dehydrogenase-like predicted oxidoreductase